MENHKFENIICFGEVLWDVFPDSKKPGGAPLNVAIHLKRQNKASKLISRIGNDLDGKSLINYLNESEIDTKYIQTDNVLETSKVLVFIDENKNASYEICEPVAWDEIQITEELKEAAGSADLIIYGSLASRNHVTRNTLYQLLAKSKAKRLLDVNLRPPFDNEQFVTELLHKSDYIKLNDEELSSIASWSNKSGNEFELLTWISRHFNCPMVCVTRGSKGAALYLQGKYFEHAGFKVNAIDTVGAGDSFLASLVAEFSKKSTPEKALEQACATGAYVASNNGAVPRYSENDINQIINSKQS